jgi:hypothetical protein
VSTINGVISLYFFSLSAGLLFSQKGLSYGFETLHGVFIHKKDKIWDFLGFFSGKTKSA